MMSLANKHVSINVTQVVLLDAEIDENVRHEIGCKIVMVTKLYCRTLYTLCLNLVKCSCLGCEFVEMFVFSFLCKTMKRHIDFA